MRYTHAPEAAPPTPCPCTRHALPCPCPCPRGRTPDRAAKAAAPGESSRPGPTRSDPASFITRNSTAGAPLSFFGLGAAGERIHLIPLRDVSDEQYVAYFMTAGSSSR